MAPTFAEHAEAMFRDTPRDNQEEKAQCLLSQLQNLSAQIKYITAGAGASSARAEPLSKKFQVMFKFLLFDLWIRAVLFSRFG